LRTDVGADSSRPFVPMHPIVSPTPARANASGHDIETGT
jgi:hypothetical protein